VKILYYRPAREGHESVLFEQRSPARREGKEKRRVSFLPRNLSGDRGKSKSPRS